MADPASHDPKVLIDGTLIPIAAAAAYTAPSGADDRGVRIIELTLTNQDTDTHWVDIWVVESGGSRGAANLIVQHFYVPSDGVPYPFLQGRMLDKGDAVHWDCQTADKIACRMDGWEMTD